MLVLTLASPVPLLFWYILSCSQFSKHELKSKSEWTCNFFILVERRWFHHCIVIFAFASSDYSCMFMGILYLHCGMSNVFFGFCGPYTVDVDTWWLGIHYCSCLSTSPGFIMVHYVNPYTYLFWSTLLALAFLYVHACSSQKETEKEELEPGKAVYYTWAEPTGSRELRWTCGSYHGKLKSEEVSTNVCLPISRPNMYSYTPIH